MYYATAKTFLDSVEFLLWTLQVSRLTWKTSCSDSTSRLPSSQRLWLDSWETATQKSPWCSRSTDPPAQERTLSASSSLTTFTKREISVDFFIPSHINLTSRMRVKPRPTRYDEITYNSYVYLLLVLYRVVGHTRLETPGTNNSNTKIIVWLTMDVIYCCFRLSCGSGSKATSRNVHAPCLSSMR